MQHAATERIAPLSACAAMKRLRKAGVAIEIANPLIDVNSAATISVMTATRWLNVKLVVAFTALNASVLSQHATWNG